MKLRYYMRGLGIGIVVTALIMGIGSSQKSTANNNADSQLNGTETSQAVVLSDLKDGQEQTSESSEASETAETAESSEPSETAGTAEASEAAETEEALEASETAEASGTEKSPEGTEASEPSGTEQTAEASEAAGAEKSPEGSGTVGTAGQTQTAEGTSDAASETESTTVAFIIENGNSSETVSRMLEEVGLVESASSFNRFLSEKGYSKSIKAGAFEIPVGTAEEEIAEIIVGNR